MSEFVYLVKSGETNRYKIGITKNIDQRFKKLGGTDALYYIQPIHHIEVTNSRVIEKYLHRNRTYARVTEERTTETQSLRRNESLRDILRKSCVSK